MGAGARVGAGRGGVVGDAIVSHPPRGVGLSVLLDLLVGRANLAKDGGPSPSLPMTESVTAPPAIVDYWSLDAALLSVARDQDG